MPDENITSGIAMRYQWESYMECKLIETPAYNLIGEGFTSFPEAKNAKEYSRKYINYKTEKTDVIGYAPSVSYSADCIVDDPVVKEIVSIHENESVGEDTHRDIVSINRWEPVAGQTNTYTARKRSWSIIPDTKGDGTDALIYTGTMKAESDIVNGTFDVSTKTFTPTT